MKVHSYISTNGYLQWVHTQAEVADKALHQLTEKVGGWDAAILSAKLHRKHLDDLEGPKVNGHSESSNGSTPQIGTPEIPEGATSGYIDAKDATALRHRLNLADSSASSTGATTPTTDHQSRLETTGNNVISALNKKEKLGPTTHPLVDHPDEEISNLAKEWTELEGELVSTGPERVRWPENITAKNFAVYQLIPTLVYELEYPRTDR